MQKQCESITLLDVVLKYLRDHGEPFKRLSGDFNELVFFEKILFVEHLRIVLGAHGRVVS